MKNIDFDKLKLLSHSFHAKDYLIIIKPPKSILTFLAYKNGKIYGTGRMKQEDIGKEIENFKDYIKVKKE
tara:strand:- start:8314 stop:8523 length:210 start_codon:yes stop_codon:yes gene_type:complete